MNFMDAVNNMSSGKRMIRQGWAGFYLAILNNQNYIWNIGNGNDKPVINAILYTPTLDDILANDWMVKL
jgi:hypothetical protein